MGSPGTPAFDEEAAVRQALAARDRGAPEEGIALIAPLLARQPQSARLWQVKGLLHRATGDSGPAMAALARAAALAPRDARIAHALARVTMEAGLPAVEAYDRARALAPGDGAVLIGRSAAQMAAGAGLAAVADLEAALEASPLWIDGHGALADLRWMMGARDAVLDSYRQALKRHPREVALWQAMLAKLFALEDFAAAASVLGPARKALGRHAMLDAAAAVIASETGDHAAADAAFARLPLAGDAPLAVRHARHLLRTGRPAEVLALAEPWLARPQAGQFWPYVGTAWRLLDDPRWRWLEDEALVRVEDVLGEADVAALAATLRPLHVTRAYPVGQSVRAGTQTDGPLFARLEPAIQDLRRRVLAVAARHLQALVHDPAHPVRRLRAPARPRIAGSWSVRLRDAGFHVSHVHPQGWFSSAFYVAVPPVADAGPAPAGWLGLGAPPADLGLDLPPWQLVEPKPGRLVLFPSILWHGTMPIAGGERLTVAFDIAPP